MGLNDGQFCPACEVHMSLHYDEDDCDGAESKAALLERFGRLGSR